MSTFTKILFAQRLKSTGGGGGGGGSFPTGADADLWLDGNLTDSSGNGKDASMLTGSETYSTGQDGISNHAFDFTSGGRVFSINDANVGNYPTSDFSISFWCKATSFSGTPIVISRGQFGTRGYYFQFVINGGDSTKAEFDANFNPAGQFKQVKTTNTTFSLNTWYHIVVVRSGGTGKIYVNGSDATNSADTFGDIGNDNVLPFQVGDYTSFGFPFNGLVDEVSLFPRALTATEILNIFTLNAR